MSNMIATTVGGNKVVPFQFEGSPVRVVTVAGEPWWVAKDVCEILGIKNSNRTIGDLCNADGVANRSDGAAKTSHEDSVQVVRINIKDSILGKIPDGVANNDQTINNAYPIVDNLGRKQYPLLINEGNLYRLMIRSRKPVARQFERWVFDEVLPSIRRTGKYAMPTSEGPTGEELLKLIMDYEIIPNKCTVYDMIDAVFHATRDFSIYTYQNKGALGYLEMLGISLDRDQNRVKISLSKSQVPEILRDKHEKIDMMQLLTLKKLYTNVHRENLQVAFLWDTVAGYLGKTPLYTSQDNYELFNQSPVEMHEHK